MRKFLYSVIVYLKQYLGHIKALITVQTVCFTIVNHVRWEENFITHISIILSSTIVFITPSFCTIADLPGIVVLFRYCFSMCKGLALRHSL